MTQATERDFASSAAADTGALIDWILERFHATHRADLATIEALIKGSDAAELPDALVPLLRNIAANLESHMQREEQVLFPLMQAGGHPMIVHPITMMRTEHEDHRRHLAALRAATGDFTLPAAAGEKSRALYAGLAKLASDLEEHIDVENEVLFPRFR